MGWLSGVSPAGPRPLPEPPPDPRIAADVLQLLATGAGTLGLHGSRTGSAPGPAQRAALQVLVGWLAAERGLYAEALESLEAAAAVRGLAAWALAGRARWPCGSGTSPPPGGFSTGPSKGPNRTTLPWPQPWPTPAAPWPTSPAATPRPGPTCTRPWKFGPDHFGAGRVLDTLGMVHATAGRFHTALAFFEQSLAVKRRFGDDAGIALTQGQLGRLYLDWDRLDEAERHFREGIELARRTGDERGEAQLCNHRGQVLLARGRPEEAAAFLDESIRLARGRFLVIEGYAHKDRALADLALNRLDAAGGECTGPKSCSRRRASPRGWPMCRRVRGVLCRQQGRHPASERLLRMAAGHFQERAEPTEAARSLAEAARTLQAAGAAPALVVDTLQPPSTTPSAAAAIR